jgi:hypothetical protein
MNEHRGEDIFELSIRVSDQKRNDQTDITPTILAGGYVWNRKESGNVATFAVRNTMTTATRPRKLIMEFLERPRRL